jgi:hypothetical protein
MNSQGYERERSWPYLKHRTGKGTEENLNNNNRSSDGDLNPDLPKTKQGKQPSGRDVRPARQ